MPLAAVSASVNLTQREIPLLAGREIIIARDLGAEGADAAVRWQDTLSDHGLTARIYTPPVKDLGEALRLPNYNSNAIFTQSQ